MDNIRLILSSKEVRWGGTPALTLVETNPFLSEGQGSYTFPFTIPSLPENDRILGYPSRIARLDQITRKYPAVLWIGPRQYVCEVTLDSITSEGYSLTASVEGGTLAGKFKEYRLNQFLDGEEVYQDTTESTAVEKIIQRLSTLHMNRDEREAAPYAMVSNVYLTYSNNNDMMFKINDYNTDGGGFITKAQDKLSSGEWAANPPGYGIVPFLRLKWILEKLFGEDFDPSPILTDSSTEPLLVSNTADAIVRGKIRYSQLAPDVSATEFISAIETYFGGKFYLSGGKPYFMTYNEWLSSSPRASLDSYLIEEPEISLPEEKYLVLSMDNRFSDVTVDGELYNYSGPSGQMIGRGFGRSKDAYSTIQEAREAWPDLAFGNWSQQGAGTPVFSWAENLFLRIDEGSWQSEGKVYECKDFTILSGNTLGYDPGFYENKHEIEIPVTPPFRFDYKTVVQIGPRWQNTMITSGEQKEKSKDNCISFLHSPLSSPSGNHYARPYKTWGEGGIYMKYYKDFDMFLRHAGIPIKAKISKRMPLDPLQSYTLFGARVVVEEIRSNTQSEYVEATLRTTELQRPYDIEKETEQIDKDIPYPGIP